MIFLRPPANSFRRLVSVTRSEARFVRQAGIESPRCNKRRTIVFGDYHFFSATAFSSWLPLLPRAANTPPDISLDRDPLDRVS